MDQINLQGHLSAAIKDFTEVTQLIFTGGKLNGPIPPKLAGLTKLTTLWLGLRDWYQHYHLSSTATVNFKTLVKMTKH